MQSLQVLMVQLMKIPLVRSVRTWHSVRMALRATLLYGTQHGFESEDHNIRSLDEAIIWI